MKERGIILSPDEVRGLKDGSLRELRKPVKPQPPAGCEYLINGAQSHVLCRQIGTHGGHTIWVPPTARSNDHRLPCPFGQPGDRLWGKETLVCGFVDPLGSVSCYAVDGEPVGDAFPWRWKRRTLPATAMPRWAARWTIEIAGVGVERDGERWVWVIAVGQVEVRP